MENEHIKSLGQLRDDLVEERRQLIASSFIDPASRREAAAEFVGLQNFIDTVERAILHEASLVRGPGLARQPTS
ncbi:hypothetical protein [Rhodoblastus sp.]|jgi:hypothetical protein|uniref:hypothetical protein n=1 Tax=Rhodoblastus sp. TaxID=1962975 RepID=UPI002610C717|nr:hypothetical protein [Rhodoblastus sp.]